MSFFERWETAMGNKDLDALIELMHPEWTMVMHSSGKVMDREGYKQTVGQVILGGKLARNDIRCIYENNDIMAEHAKVTFPNGSTDAVLVAMTLKDGKVIRTETGSTPLTK